MLHQVLLFVWIEELRVNFLVNLELSLSVLHNLHVTWGDSFTIFSFCKSSFSSSLCSLLPFLFPLLSPLFLCHPKAFTDILGNSACTIFVESVWLMKAAHAFDLLSDALVIAKVSRLAFTHDLCLVLAIAGEHTLYLASLPVRK